MLVVVQMFTILVWIMSEAWASISFKRFLSQLLFRPSLNCTSVQNGLIPSHVPYKQSVITHGYHWNPHTQSSFLKVQVLRSRQAHYLVWSSDTHLPCSGSFATLLHSLYSFSFRNSTCTVRFLLSITTAAGLQSITTHHAAFNSYLQHAPQMLKIPHWVAQSYQPWADNNNNNNDNKDCRCMYFKLSASIRTLPLFKTQPLLDSVLGPWPLFEPGFYMDKYGK